MKLRCPRCASTKVYLVPDLPNNTNIYYCEKCTEIFEKQEGITTHMAP